MFLMYKRLELRRKSEYEWEWFKKKKIRRRVKIRKKSYYTLNFNRPFALLNKKISERKHFTKFLLGAPTYEEEGQNGTLVSGGKPGLCIRQILVSKLKRNIGTLKHCKRTLSLFSFPILKFFKMSNLLTTCVVHWYKYPHVSTNHIIGL
jgi:hypothetical protein